MKDDIVEVELAPILEVGIPVAAADLIAPTKLADLPGVKRIEATGYPTLM